MQFDKSIFWFSQYILLENLSKRIHQFFDLINISCSKTFLSKYINLLILSIYLARKPFRVNISIIWFLWYISLKNLSEWIYQFSDFYDISRLKTFPSKYIDFWILMIYLAWKPFWVKLLIFGFSKILNLGFVKFKIFIIFKYSNFHIFYKKLEFLKNFQNLGINFFVKSENLHF